MMGSTSMSFMPTEPSFRSLSSDILNAAQIDIITPKRDSIVKNFRLGKIWVMIATDLMARGLDFKVSFCLCLRQPIWITNRSQGCQHGHQLRLSAFSHRICPSHWFESSFCAHHYLQTGIISRAYGACWSRGRGCDIFHRGGSPSSSQVSCQ